MEQQQQDTERGARSAEVDRTPERRATSNPAILALAWLAVGLPLLWGVAQTLRKTFALFS